MPIQAEILFGAILLASFYYFIGFYRIRRMLWEKKYEASSGG